MKVESSCAFPPSDRFYPTVLITYLILLILKKPFIADSSI